MDARVTAAAVAAVLLAGCGAVAVPLVSQASAASSIATHASGVAHSASNISHASSSAPSSVSAPPISGSRSSTATNLATLSKPPLPAYWVLSAAPPVAPGGSGRTESLDSAMNALTCTTLNQANDSAKSARILLNSYGSGSLAVAVPGDATYVYQLGGMSFAFVVSPHHRFQGDLQWGNAQYDAGQNGGIAVEVASGKYTAAVGSGLLLPMTQTERLCHARYEAGAPSSSPSIAQVGSSSSSVASPPSVSCPVHASAVIAPAGFAAVPWAEAASVDAVLHNPAFNQPAVAVGTVGYFLGPKREESTFGCSSDANLVLVASLLGSSPPLPVMIPGPTSRALSLLLLNIDGHRAEIIGGLLKGANGTPYIAAKGIYSTSPYIKAITVA